MWPLQEQICPKGCLIDSMQMVAGHNLPHAQDILSVERSRQACQKQKLVSYQGADFLVLAQAVHLLSAAEDWMVAS